MRRIHDAVDTLFPTNLDHLSPRHDNAWIAYDAVYNADGFRFGIGSRGGRSRDRANVFAERLQYLSMCRWEPELKFGERNERIGITNVFNILEYAGISG